MGIVDGCLSSTQSRNSLKICRPFKRHIIIHGQRTARQWVPDPLLARLFSYGIQTSQNLLCRLRIKTARKSHHHIAVCQGHIDLRQIIFRSSGISSLGCITVSLQIRKYGIRCSKSRRVILETVICIDIADQRPRYRTRCLRCDIVVICHASSINLTGHVIGKYDFIATILILKRRNAFLRSFINFKRINIRSRKIADF